MKVALFDTQVFENIEPITDLRIACGGTLQMVVAHFEPTGGERPYSMLANPLLARQGVVASYKRQPTLARGRRP